MRMASRGYYQVGGLRGQVIPSEQNKWDYKALAKALGNPYVQLRVAGDPQGPIELVLGIKKTGASCLLITANEAIQYSRVVRNTPVRGYPMLPNSFESLSPIYFDGIEELEKKLKLLAPKNQKKNGASNRIPGDTVDTSQANKSYNEGDEGIARGEFEINRVFYKAIQRSLKLERYNLQPETLRKAESARLCALSYSVWQTVYDTRSASERLRDPKILDLAFTELEMPSFKLKIGTIKHFVVKENSTLGSHKDRKPFTDGPSETLSEELIGKRVSEFLSRGTGPTILLVFDEEATNFALKKLGVVHRGLKIQSFLYREQPDEYEERRNRRRSRSRSPQRRSSGSIPESSVRKESIKRPLVSESVILDVQKLFATMMNETNPPGTLDISGRLNVYHSGPNEWGAAFEVGLLIDCWKAMASGPAIDEQRENWRREERGGPSIDNSLLMRPEDIDLDEYDPNDYTPQVAASTSTSKRSVISMSAMRGDQADPDESDDYE